ncbi:MAG: hypothetical protein AB7G80_03095 [Dongiaceae bacterium]
MRYFLLLGVLVMGLQACAPLPPMPPVYLSWLHSSAARTAQEGMLEANAGDSDRYYRAHLRINGQDKTITTRAPLVLGRLGRGDEEAYSIARFSYDQNEIHLFSRNPQNGEGFRAIIPLEDVKTYPEFSFPIIRDGKLKMLPVQIISVERRPDRPDAVKGMRYYLQRHLPDVPDQKLPYKSEIEAEKKRTPVRQDF